MSEFTNRFTNSITLVLTLLACLQVSPQTCSAQQFASVDESEVVPTELAFLKALQKLKVLDIQVCQPDSQESASGQRKSQ